MTPDQVIPVPSPHFRFVLVHTTEPGNVGSACRVLANFGFTPTDLVLVDPRCAWRSEKALARAGQAHYWLGQLRVISSLPEAVADCVRVVGTTAQVIEKLRRQFARPVRAAMVDLVPQARSQPVAVLFGTEQTGLSHEQLLVCDELITIPTAPAYPSLNLAVSVGLVAYEITQQVAKNAETRSSRSPDHQITRSPDFQVGPGSVEQKAADLTEIPFDEQPAEARLVEIMFQELYRAAETIEFFNPQNPLPLQYALRRILGKAHLTNQEARVLMGLARQILWKCGKKP